MPPGRTISGGWTASRRAWRLDAAGAFPRSGPPARPEGRAFRDLVRAGPQTLEGTGDVSLRPGIGLDLHRCQPRPLGLRFVSALSDHDVRDGPAGPDSVLCG